MKKANMLSEYDLPQGDNSIGGLIDGVKSLINYFTELKELIALGKDPNYLIGYINNSIEEGNTILNFAREKLSPIEDNITESSKKQKKFNKIMGEFGNGTLKTSAGDKVTDRKQAIAIAYSESGLDENNENSKQKNMNNRIKIKESELRNLVKNTIVKVLKEDKWASDGGYYSGRDERVHISKEEVYLLKNDIENFKNAITSKDGVVKIDNSDEGRFYYELIKKLHQNKGIDFYYDSEDGVDFYWLAPDQNIQDVFNALNGAERYFYDVVDEAKCLKEENGVVDAFNSGDSEPFVTHGVYTLGNAGGYEIMLSKDGDSAKVRDAFGSDNPETSNWLPIEYVENEETGELDPVIDPNGYDIPLNNVMRSNSFKVDFVTPEDAAYNDYSREGLGEAKQQSKTKLKIKESELVNLVNRAVLSEMTKHLKEDDSDGSNKYSVKYTFEGEPYSFEKTGLNNAIGYAKSMSTKHGVNVSVCDKASGKIVKKIKFSESISNNLSNKDSLQEKWDKDVDVKSTGEHAGKTIEQLQSELSALKNRSKKYQDAGKKVPESIKDQEKEIMFAIRAKRNFKGGIKEDAFNDDGEPMMTNSQYRGYSEPSEPDYDDSGNEYEEEYTPKSVIKLIENEFNTKLVYFSNNEYLIPTNDNIEILLSFINKYVVTCIIVNSKTGDTIKEFPEIDISELDIDKLINFLKPYDSYILTGKPMYDFINNVNSMDESKEDSNKLKITESELKSLIIEKVMKVLNENWGDMHQTNSFNSEPDGYNVGSRYYYVNGERGKNRNFTPDYNPIFVISDIENGKINSVDTKNNYQDNPSVGELNDLIKSGRVVVKESKTNLREGVAKNNPKIEKFVNDLNQLISTFKDSNGDPVGVIDKTSTWEEPYVYLPIEYRNGALKISSYSEMRPQKTETEIIRSRDMEDDGIPTLKHIKHMYIVASKKPNFGREEY